ncbi:MAG: HPF/RaiA family ribosome-associated protein [Candidatus Omnitrophota bacterium]|nr:MAG: HPF/RaiA family ribosome-associated protein [Candidatus Omnitrophota bacterium]
MRVDVSFKHLARSEFIDNVIDKNLKKVERRIKIFRRDDPIHISIHVEKNPNREQYFCRTHIYLPSKVLVVDERGTNSSMAINKAFSAISKQLDKFKHKMERHLRKKW